MPINQQRAQARLRQFDLQPLFIEEMGWDYASLSVDVDVDDTTYVLQSIAEKRGMLALCYDAGADMPNYATRRKIEHRVAKSIHEHLIIYTSQDQGLQIWQWVKREPGKPAACREHTYYTSQLGQGLIQKLDSIVFELAEEESLTLVDATSRVRAAFDVEKVTKKFYDRFKKEHAAFLKFLKGIPDEELQRWYASVMLNRLMFIYFIQKKGFLNGDTDYLRNQLTASKAIGKDRFYRHTLCPLFFEGFAKEPKDRPADIRKQLGEIPYLNGGLFLPHQIEKAHGKKIDIPDKAFENIFDFFDGYQWHLDERPLKNDTEINPDVLGFIFEKYINQKQMGAYYTKEDITGYITRSTVIPFLFDTAKKKCKIAFEGPRAVWRLLKEDPDRYIYPAMRHGMNWDIHTSQTLDAPLELPANIAAGVDDVSKRTDWNTPAPAKFALPTEIWRETIARRQRYTDIRDKLAAGEVTDINELITLNLDIEQFIQDVVETAEGPELLRAFWVAIAGKIPDKSNQKYHQGITVLDPACGSGAFLFAALNLLETLYEACLDRMQAFLDELGPETKSKKYGDFRSILEQINHHPSRKYFIYKSIVISNLYGVDIMDEAVEICKLRLFLKLVAQVDTVDQIEPLPDIDFNIRAGNSLVGYAREEDVEKALMRGQDALLLASAKQDAFEKIKERLKTVDELFNQFRLQQTQLGGTVTATDKQTLLDELAKLDEELNEHLASEYGIEKAKREKEYAAWLKSHQPFHWFTHFYGIISSGGFDTVIGNPPYVSRTNAVKEYRVLEYKTDACSDIYAWFIERAHMLLSAEGTTGMIVPLSITFSSKFKSLRSLLASQYRRNWYSSYGRIPSALFSADVRVRNTIAISHRHGTVPISQTTRLHRWFTSEREHLLSMLEYTEYCPANWNGCIPKLDSSDIGHVFAQLQSQFSTTTLDTATVKGENEFRLSFKKSAYNWLCFCHKHPPCYDEHGVLIPQTKFGDIYFQNRNSRDTAFLLLNGKLMFVYWATVGDDFDVTRWMFADFPVDIAVLADALSQHLPDRTDQLRDAMKSQLQFKLNAGKRVGTYNLARCRHVTDAIDACIAEALGIEGASDAFELAYSRMIKTDFNEPEATQ